MRDSEALFEELDAIETQCAVGGDGQLDSATLRKRWDSAKEDLRAADVDAIDPQTRLLLKRRLAEAGIELLALMYREDASDAQFFPAILLELEPTDDLRAEILGAELDRSSFQRLCRARREIYESPRASRAELKKIIKETEEAGLQDAARAALELPRPVSSAPILFTFNTLGFGLYGSRDPIGSTVIKTHALCALFIPLFPIAAYRVQDAGDDGYYFISKNRLSRFARHSRSAILVGLVALVSWFFINNHLNSPTRQARLAMEDAQGLVAAGKTAEAIAAYEELASKYGVQGGRQRMHEAGTALVPLYLAEAPTPVRLDNQQEARAILNRYRRLPKFVKGHQANEAMSGAVVQWAHSLDGPTIDERMASLHMLEEAQTILGSGNPEIAAMREQQRLALAATITVDRPADGLELFMEAGKSGWPAAGAILHALNLSQLHSVERLRNAWIQNNPDDTTLQARIAEAKAIFDAPERQSLLEQPTEAALREAIDAGAVGQDLRLALADLYLSQGRSEEALALLKSIGKPGEMIRDAQLALAQAFAEEDKLPQADDVLTAYLSVRLPRLQEASSNYDRRAETLQNEAYAKAESGSLPPHLNNRLNAISNEDEQLRVFQDWLYERIENDPKAQELRQRYDEYTDVVPAVLQQGMVKLQRANSSTGAERDALLADAERSFLAISSAAAGLPSYHLNLGTVYFRLGKTEAGEAEFAELLSQNNPELDLAVAYSYRELQLLPKARAVATKIWEQKQEPHHYSAAVLLSLMATDIGDEEKWLLRSDRDDPNIQIRLTSLEARKAARAGDDGKADALYAKVAKHYASDASNSSASLNNAALANQGRYAVTGKPKHLETARAGLEKALVTAPDNAIITSNLLTLQAHLGSLELLEDWIRLDDVRPDGADAETLLDALLRGPLRDQLTPKMQQNASLRRARTLGKQLQMLSPNALESWTSELHWGTSLRDEKLMAALLPRVEAAAFDDSEQEKNRQRFVAGELDAELTRNAEESIARTARQLEQARKGGHGPTVGALALLQASNYGTLEAMTLDVEAAQTAAELLREAHKAWPQLGANHSLVLQLFTVALFRAVQGDQALTAFCNQEGRRYGMGPLMFWGDAYQKVKEPLLAKLKAQPEYRQAVDLALTLGSANPRLKFWLLGQIDENPKLIELNQPFFAQRYQAMEAEIRMALMPRSLLDARRWEIVRANAD